MASSFECFPKLPPELRLKIWNHAIEPQIVTVESPSAYFQRSSNRKKKPVLPTTPALLHVCRESRTLMLPIYGSVYKNSDQEWEWNGGTQYNEVRQGVRALRVSLPEGPKPKEVLMEGLLKYLNDPGGQKTVSKFVQLSPTQHFPVWFATTHDTMLFRLDRYDRAYPEHYLWGPWTSSTLKHVALEFGDPIYGPGYGFMHTSFINCMSPPYPAWLSGPLGAKSAGQQPITGVNDIESIDLLIRDAREVVRISLDENGLLDPGQWSYKLTTQSSLYQSQMGALFSNVTWEVLLAKNADHCLWDIASTWTPNISAWQVQRWGLCKDNDSVSQIWKKEQPLDAYEAYFLNGLRGQWPFAAGLEIPTLLGSSKDMYLGP